MYIHSFVFLMWHWWLNHLLHLVHSFFFLSIIKAVFIILTFTFYFQKKIMILNQMPMWQCCIFSFLTITILQQILVILSETMFLTSRIVEDKVVLSLSVHITMYFSQGLYCFGLFSWFHFGVSVWCISEEQNFYKIDRKWFMQFLLKSFISLKFYNQSQIYE